MRRCWRDGWHLMDSHKHHAGPDSYLSLDVVVVSALGDSNVPAVTVNGGSFVLASGPQSVAAPTLNGGSVISSSALTPAPRRGKPPPPPPAS